MYKPLTESLDVYDVSNRNLFAAMETPQEDATLRKGERRTTVGMAPLWCVDPGTSKLRAVAIDAAAKVDAETSDAAFGVDANTIQFHATEGGDAVYVLGEHKLRVWLADAARPEAMTKASAGEIILTGVLPDATVKHIVEPGRIKELIILEKPPRSNRFDWGFDSSLTPKLRDEQVIWVAGESTRLVFAIPQVWDATGMPIAAWYELDERSVSIVVDAKSLESAVYPVTIDPTTTTNQAAVTANICATNGAWPGIEYWRSYFKFTMPELPSLGSIDTAVFKAAWFENSFNTGSPTLDLYGDEVGAWTEGSGYGTLNALSFNGVLSQNNPSGSVYTPNTIGSIKGDGAAGLVKFYADNGDAPSDPFTVMAQASDLAQTPAGQNSALVVESNDGTSKMIGLYGRTDASNYPRIEIVWTEAAAPSGNPWYYYSQM